MDFAYFIKGELISFQDDVRLWGFLSAMSGKSSNVHMARDVILNRMHVRKLFVTGQRFGANRYKTTHCSWGCKFDTVQPCHPLRYSRGIVAGLRLVLRFRRVGGATDGRQRSPWERAALRRARQPFNGTWIASSLRQHRRRTRSASSREVLCGVAGPAACVQLTPLGNSAHF